MLNSWYKWKRPTSIPYPNIWHRFTSKTKDGKVYNIKIVDLSADRFEEIMEFSKEYFFSREPICVSSKVVEDERTMHNLQSKHRAILQQHTSIVAVLDEDVPKPEIVGMLKLLVASKEDDPIPKPQIPGNFMPIKDKLFEKLEKNHDPFDIFNTDKVFREYGLCVKPGYEGLNIGYNILFAVEKLAKAFHIKASVITANSIQSQIIADKIGYKTWNEIVYNEFKDNQGRVVFPVEGTKSIKLMAIEFI
ncbi:uncharacterized protein LOC135832712 isoform X2 [Planococcus citri]|uniref:uncharacterized protein LOC135832712 isoform X2 n=1 Tax=Planococcus citri TaxID=170843 RepID=UPI0031F93117